MRQRALKPAASGPLNVFCICLAKQRKCTFMIIPEKTLQRGGDRNRPLPGLFPQLAGVAASCGAEYKRESATMRADSDRCNLPLRRKRCRICRCASAMRHLSFSSSTCSSILAILSNGTASKKGPARHPVWACFGPGLLMQFACVLHQRLAILLKMPTAIAVIATS